MLKLSVVSLVWYFSTILVKVVENLKFKNKIKFNNFFREMTDETNASLLFAILPSVSAVCQSDPETASKLREIFVRVEKHAPGLAGFCSRPVRRGKESAVSI